MSDGAQEDLGRAWGHTAGAAFRASAEYLAALSEDELHGPTGCTDWDQRMLAGHILGEAVWFPNMLQAATTGSPTHSAELYEEMKGWSPERQSARLGEAADQLDTVIDEVIPRYAQESVDVGWTELPLWQSTYVILMEAVYHDWDTRAGRDPRAAIPTRWALQMVRGIGFSAPLIAHRVAVERTTGRYLLHVGDGVGPITVIAQNGTLTVERGASGRSDITLNLTADQYVRLVAGRFSPADSVARGDLQVDGDRGRLEELEQIFGGIANN